MTVNKNALLLYALLGGIVILNIISSQSISDQFFGLSKGHKQPATEFLQKIRKESYFSYFFNEISGFFQQDLKDEVYSETLERQKKIQELQNVLQQNPRSRDAFYNLYILYLQEGEEEIAQEYLRQAQQIDPEIQ